MIKILHVVAIAGLIGSALWAYTIKYATIFEGEELARLERDVAQERETIAVLRAEWAHLNRPDRVEALTNELLPEIVPIGAERLARFSDLPERAASGDAIGAKLEALGLAAPTATPASTGAVTTAPASTQTPTR